MTYSFYSYGGGEYLWRVLNGVALMFKANSPYCSMILGLFAALGGVFLCIKAIVQHQADLWLKNWLVGVVIFITLGITPKVTMHIIDDVNPNQKYAKVDHVPVFLAFVLSKSSVFSKSVTDHLENILVPVEACQYGKTGGMFGARLAKKMREVSVSDPVMRQNLKDFVHQCFTLPFVQTNMTPGRREALKTTDILGLISANPHQWLGSYWRGEDGETVFQYCKDGARQAQAILKAEVPFGVLGLASSLFGLPKENSFQVTNRLKSYFSGGWESLGGMASDLNNAVGQAMMMNAYFEGNDDKREEFGLSRRHGDLIAMSSTRGLIQKSMSSILEGDMMQNLLPLIHSTMICFLSVAFLFIAPMALFTGGMGTLWMWVKLIAWVQSWPIFFVILNALSLMVIPHQTSVYQDSGGGLSLISQAGVYEVALYTYGIFQALMAMTLGLSWSIVTGSLQGMATSLDGLSRSQSGIASKLGSELVDGNVSVDNQSLHNKTVASTQLAQQQLGSSFGFSHRMEDGRMASIGGTDGQKIFKEDMSSLKTNIMESEDLSASLREDGARSLAASKEYGKLAGEQAVEASNELFDYSKSITSSKDRSHGFGYTKSSGETQSYQRMLDTAHKFAQSQGISDQEAFDALALSGGTLSAMASNNKHVEAAKSSGLSEQFGQDMKKSIDTMNDRKGSFSDSAQENAAKNFQGSYGKMKHYEEQQGARLAESEMYTKTASFAENRSLGLSTNITDDVLTSFADAKFDGNKEEAVRYASAHSDEFKEFAGSYHSPRYEDFKEKLKSQNPMSAQDVQKVYDSVYNPSVSNTTSRASFNEAETYAHNRGLNSQKEQHISSDIQGLQEQSERHENKTGKTFDSKQSALQGTMNADEKDFNSQKDSSLVYRSGKTAVKGVVREVSPVVSFIGKHALQPEERNEGMGASSYHQIPNPKHAPPVKSTS